MEEKSYQERLGALIAREGERLDDLADKERAKEQASKDILNWLDDCVDSIVSSTFKGWVKSYIKKGPNPKLPNPSQDDLDCFHSALDVIREQDPPAKMFLEKPNLGREICLHLAHYYCNLVRDAKMLTTAYRLSRNAGAPFAKEALAIWESFKKQASTLADEQAKALIEERIGGSL